MNVKRSLMVLSISLILLVSVSFVSAGFWDWLTGDATGGSSSVAIRPTSITETVKLGKTAELSQDTSLTITEVEGDTVTATVTNEKTGFTEQVTLQKGTNTLTDGTVLQVSNFQESGFLRKAKATVSWSSPGSEGGLATGTEGLTSTITSVQEGETVVDGRIVNLENGRLTIEGKFSTDIPSEGDQFMLPIPVKFCHWLVTRGADTNTFTFETICEAGAGLEGAGSGTGETEKGCIDTDEGSNLKVKGTTYMSDNLVDKWTDYCISGSSIAGGTSSQIMEYTCVEGVVTENVRDCETTCVDGACV